MGQQPYLADLAQISSGGTPPKSDASAWTGPVPWVSPKDMKRPYIDDAEDHISESAVEKIGRQADPAE